MDTVQPSRLVCEVSDRYSESSGSENPVRAASALTVCSWRSGCEHWQGSRYMSDEPSERGRPCPALTGTVQALALAPFDAGSEF